jgi:hypothetical protein
MLGATMMPRIFSTESKPAIVFASVSLFEKMPILQAFQDFEIPPDNNDACIQLNLFEL